MIHRSLWLVLVFTVVMLSSATVARAADRQRVLFEDEFAGKLGDGWSWVYEDPPNWRVVAGKFQIRPTGGSSWMKNRDGRNYLVRTPPEVQGGELAVEVFVENRPTQPYEHAGLMWYYDDDHYVTLNKEQIDGKPTVLWVVEKAGIPQPPFGDTPYQNDGIWLRLRVLGTQITGEYRTTAQEPWRTVGNRELPVHGPARICLHAGYAPKNDPDRWATFSHFRVVRLEK